MRSLTLGLLLASLAMPAFAEDLLEEAKTQYAAAAYEDALSTLTRASESVPNKIELEQYRAFCLIALGRTDDAERAIAALVGADPRYVPSESVASPKVLSMVSDMRRKELPAVARRLLGEGRAAFKQQELAVAREKLTLLLELLDDPALKNRPESEDLRVIAEGFVALAAAPAPAPAAPAPTAASSAVPALPPSETLVEPVAVRQYVPAWVPPNSVAASREYQGAVRVRIGIDGRVKSASIEKPTFPSYDAGLLLATREWLFKPATRNGAPIESERVIPIRLRPR